MSASSIIKTIRLEAPRTLEYEPVYETEKDKRKFIDQVKRAIRSSKEYKDYIRFLKDNMDMDKCAFFSNVKHTKENKISIEVHHEPFTLDDIVRIIITKQIEEGKPLNELDIADEVMELHYNDEVGLVPLSKTVHDVIHSDTDKLFVPLTLCYGNYKKFVEDYQDYMEDDILSRLEKKIELTKNVKEDSFSALDIKFEYLNVDGVDLVLPIEMESNQVA